MTVFSFVNAILLQPLPRVERPNRLAELYTSYTGGMRFGAVSYPDYVDFRDRNQVFDGLLAQRLILVNLNQDGENEIVPGAVVSGNYFSVLGVKAERGRTFVGEEDRTPGANSIAVISRSLWQPRIGDSFRDRLVVGEERVDQQSVDPFLAGAVRLARRRGDGVLHQGGT